MHFLDKGRSTFGDLFICAKDLLVEATVTKADDMPLYWLVYRHNNSDRPPLSGPGGMLV